MQDEREAQLRALGEILAYHQKLLDEASEIVRREFPIVSNLTQAVAALMGETPITELGMTTGNATADSMLPNGRKTEPVNSGETHPKRKDLYKDLTLIHGVRKALEKLT